MSSKLGAVKYGTSDGEPFLGRTMGHERDYSEKIAAEIDSEVRTLIELAHDEAWEILVEYRDVLDTIVEELMEKETISQTDLARICARVVKRPPMAPFSVNGRRRRPTTEPAPNGSDYGQPVRLGGDNEPVRFGGVSSGDGPDGTN
jgi:cell division protease FtsH